MSKKVQKTVYFDPDVWKAIEDKMKMSKNNNHSVVVNDGMRYAMFPEYRNDRDADLVKLYNQFSASLAQHRKKTARDLAFIQEMVLKSMFTFFEHYSEVPEGEAEARKTQANARLDRFMEDVMRNIGELKPLSDREEKS